ncbi:MAG: hypothetical protein V3S00_01030 [Dehalococcoidia bacterium]
MKRLTFLVGAATGLALGSGLMPADRRARLCETLAQMPRTMMEHCLQCMPEDSPPKVMMSGLRRIQAQNDEIIALLAEQNNLLRQRLPVDRPSPP